MTDAATKDANRNALIAKVHVAKNDLALRDDTYRQVLKRMTGKRSAADCSNQQLDQVIEEFKRLGWKPNYRRRRAGPRPMAEGPQAGKARALWLALYHLGEIEDPSEATLAGFARRVTKQEALQWLDADQLNKVIEGLKDRCTRAGFVAPTPDRLKQINGARRGAGQGALGIGFAAKCNLIEALWNRLIKAGAFEHGEYARLGTWLKKSWSVAAPQFLNPRDADMAIERLGSWLRKVKAAKS